MVEAISILKRPGSPLIAFSGHDLLLLSVPVLPRLLELSLLLHRIYIIPQTLYYLVLVNYLDSEAVELPMSLWIALSRTLRARLGIDFDSGVHL